MQQGREKIGNVEHNFNNTVKNMNNQDNKIIKFNDIMAVDQTWRQTNACEHAPTKMTLHFTEVDFIARHTAQKIGRRK